ncbi:MULTISPECIES: DUF4197 domain-containing protein [Thioalkalivibrio]|uniref:DUF4197 domain-containing protein n=1 Tax=Thioalkalivibrio halophilus TaxID=252474 RepID=A0A1V3A083_9GAMM|nr:MULTISPECIES: DUF4197 domain-containing protein [Thioalkalivibrio]OOC10752.1 hypothetical protein B1A74_04125 [Thioalkalivibrio halophilus]PYG04479.1 uncharacterized protein DUF4197 [Thioalkalivibrio sp. ALE21]
MSSTSRLAGRRRFLFRLLPATALLAAAPAGADWWERGREALGSLTGGDNGSALSQDERIDALREALSIATRNATGELARHDGFWGNPEVRIPLPGLVQSTRDTLDRFGAAGPVDDLHERMNRAAEDAAPQARELFLDAIEDLTLDEAREIIRGPDDAATRHFETRMSDPLAARMEPVIDEALRESGAISAYNDLLAEVEDIPFVADIAFDPVDHVLGYAMSGLFDTLAKEEAALRADPVGRGTELLERVFGGGE